MEDGTNHQAHLLANAHMNNHFSSNNPATNIYYPQRAQENKAVQL